MKANGKCGHLKIGNRGQSCVAYPAMEATTPNDKEWLTEAEILKQFDFSKATLRRRIAEGMPCSKIGGKKQFSRTLVSDWLAKIASEA